MDPRTRHAELARELLEHDHRYHVEGRPTVNDWNNPAKFLT